jgi:hypothetical protein
MTDSFCGYHGDRDEALIAFLYDEGGADAKEGGVFAAHLAACDRCRDELAALRGVRTQLARWAPPEPAFSALSANPQSTIHNPQSAARSPQSALGDPQWWRQIPAWAQVAAALLFLGLSAGIANLHVRYDANGLSVRTGWMPASSTVPAGVAAPAGEAPALNSSTAPWRADLAALERQLKADFRTAQVAAGPALVPAPVSRVAATDADLLRRVRALLDESEKRQQRELALRVAEVIRDVTMQRQADLVKIDRTLGVVQNNLGVEVMRDRQRLDLLYRASQRQ